MTYKQKKWLHGLISGFIGGCVTAIDTTLITIMAGPREFNLDDKLVKTVIYAAVVGIIGGVKTAVVYLKQSPLPPLDEEGVTENKNNGTHMKTIIAITVGIVIAFLVTKAHAGVIPGGQREQATTESHNLSVGLEPYGTISWRGVNGESDLGAGVGLNFALTKSLSLTAFGEGTSTKDSTLLDQVDQFGGGLRYTAWLGDRVSLDGGVQGCYDNVASTFFIRLPLGANAYIVKTDRFKFGPRVQYAFDISGKGPNGASRGILQGGLVAQFDF